MADSKSSLDPWSTSYEPYPWELTGTEFFRSHRAMLQTQGNYKAAVSPFIAPLDVPDSVAVLVREATRELARFGAEPQSAFPQLLPILLHAESAASSLIEGIPASARKVALAQIDAPVPETAELVAANIRANRTALRSDAPASSATIIETQRTLLGDSHPDITGRWRDHQVWIGGGDTPHSAAFVPPHHSRIPELIDDLEVFSARTDLPVVAKAAIAHAQFETVHPFFDGNGRTGRAMLCAMLQRDAFSGAMILPISTGMLAGTDAYFKALTEYRTGNIAAIVAFVAEAVLHAAELARGLIQEVQAVVQRWHAINVGSVYAFMQQLVDFLVSQPVITPSVVAKHLGVEELVARTAVRQLAEVGILAQNSAGRREGVWHAPEIISAIDGLIVQARRRR